MPVVESLDHAVTDVREEQPQLRWIPPERWHLTIAFFGEEQARDVARLTRRVARGVESQHPLELQLSEAGRFGDRVLWIGVTGDRAPLVALGRRLATDDRAYRPHLTVARGRTGADLRRSVERLKTYRGPSWTATEVELIESHLGPRPTYDTVATWPLAGPKREGPGRG